MEFDLFRERRSSHWVKGGGVSKRGVYNWGQACFIPSSLAQVCFLINAQPRNLLQNPDAGHGTQGWRTYGQATIENGVNGNPCFVVRNGGYFIQNVNSSL